MAAALARSEVSLEDRWTASDGWFYMTGMQALVRLPIQQRLRDAAASLNTGGYVVQVAWWPWQNFQIGVQYRGFLLYNGASTNYDGFGRNASDNNTLYVFTWLDF